MTKKSAGILLYRKIHGILEFFIVHPGGPFWAKKDEGAWSIPKGEFTDQENPLDAAIREFREETGQKISGDFIPLTPVKQRSGKWVYAFALEFDFDAHHFRSNHFRIEWPPKSGQFHEFPEIDQATWVDYATCKQKLNPGQMIFVDELNEKLLEL